MIQETITYQCRACQSTNIVKNGHNAQGQQQYWCKACNKRAVLVLKVRYTEAQKEQIMAAYYERSSMRGIERIFGVSRHTLANWLKKSNHRSNPSPDPSTSPRG